MTEEVNEWQQMVAELQAQVHDRQAQLSAVQAVMGQKDQRIAELEGQRLKERLRNAEWERRQAKTSRTSSKPPSSDGYGRPYLPRTKSQKPTGGQSGHRGETLHQVSTPDRLVVHRPEQCEACQHPLPAEGGQLTERREVFDLPPLRLLVTEHQAWEVACPACQHRCRAPFPKGVEAAAQYGGEIQALVVYLSQFQLLPLARIVELVADLDLGSLSEGTIVSWVQQAGSSLLPTLSSIKQGLLQAKVAHADETGGRIGGVLHWFHVLSHRWLTFSGWHRKRGREAMNAIGVLPQYRGHLVHDRLLSYDGDDCQQSWCGAHLMREARLVAEQDQQDWAAGMVSLLAQMNQATSAARAHQRCALVPSERDQLVAQYFDLLQQGYGIWHRDHPPPAHPPPKKPGRPKQDEAKNLLDALLLGAERVLAFVDDLGVPFTNNQAERDLRMSHPSSKRSRAPFAARPGPRLFAPLAATFPPCASRGVPCWRLWLPSLRAPRSLWLGNRGPE